MTKSKSKPTTFKTDTETYLTSIGARPSNFYAYVLDTIIGELWITVYDDWIACRWDNVDKARAAGLGCNPYSGKWNFHFSSGTAGAAASTLTYFQEELSRFLPPAA